MTGRTTVAGADPPLPKITGVSGMLLLFLFCVGPVSLRCPSGASTMLPLDRIRQVAGEHPRL